MTYDNDRKSIDLRHMKLPSPWGVSIFLLILYAFFFQYGVISISNAMLVLNAVCILFGVAHVVAGAFKRKKTFYSGIIVFVMISIITSILFGASASASIDTGIRMIEYCLTGLSIFLYSISSENRFKNVLLLTWASIVLLAINVFLNGTVVNYQRAIGIGSLNSNEMSSFFVLMLFCTFYLYGETSSRFQRIILWVSLFLVFFIQIQLASRRGFIVMVFMIVANIIFAVIPYSNRNNSRRRLIVYSLIIIAGAIAFIELRDYILGSTVLGERLVGTMTGGDAARARYREFAFNQFKLHPVFGVGVGGINYLQGVYSHSLFYEVLSCTGIIGSIILLTAFVNPFKELSIKLYKNRNALESDKLKIYYVKVLLIYIAALFISGFAVVMIYDFYFYLSLGLIAAGIQFVRGSM